MSLGVSPTASSSFPSPLQTSGSLPRGGGILIKSPDDAARRISLPGSGSPGIGLSINVSGPPSPEYEKSAPLLTPLDISGAHHGAPEGSGSVSAGAGAGGNIGGGGGGGTGTGTTPRIRFAPLPDSTRPRSSSTGADPSWTDSGEGQQHQTVVVTDVKGYDNALESDDDDDDDERREKRGRRWSKSMTKGMGSVDWGSGWKGTKKILTMGLIGDDEDEGYSNGAPLKKSISTGGLIGSSPFRWNAETERKKTMLGTSPGSTSGSFLSPRDTPSHRRGSSLEANGQLLGTSPSKPVVRMLNGRVYGGRRASEAAEAEKRRRESNEPAFVEWGGSKSGGGMGSNQGSVGRGESVDDEEDGSGMEWVRKRRQKREQERREREAREKGLETDGESGAESDVGPPRSGVGVQNGRPGPTSQTSGSASGSGSSQSANETRSPVTPSLNLSELPPTPIIQISEHLTPSISAPEGTYPSSGTGVKTTMIPTPEIRVGGPGSKASTPIGISANSRRPGTEHDVFDEDDSEGKKRGGGNHSSDDESDSEEEEEEEDEDEGDFSEDEEEEEEFRTTSSAAGIEKLSRHREQHAPQSQTNDHTRGDTASTGNSQSQSEAPSQGLAVPTS